MVDILFGIPYLHYFTFFTCFFFIPCEYCINSKTKQNRPIIQKLFEIPDEMTNSEALFLKATAPWCDRIYTDALAATGTLSDGKGRLMERDKHSGRVGIKNSEFGLHFRSAACGTGECKQGQFSITMAYRKQEDTA